MTNFLGGVTAPLDPKDKRCDHICLLPDDHVEAGQSHQYGYELPSPRQRIAELEAERDRLLRVLLQAASNCATCQTFIEPALNKADTDA